MSGMIKDFFDRPSILLRGRSSRSLTWFLFPAGNGATVPVRALSGSPLAISSRGLMACDFKEVISGRDAEKCRELGETIAGDAQLGIY